MADPVGEVVGSFFDQMVLPEGGRGRAGGHSVTERGLPMGYDNDRYVQPPTRRTVPWLAGGKLLVPFFNKPTIEAYLRHVHRVQSKSRYESYDHEYTGT